jgi:hypothetical protein
MFAQPQQRVVVMILLLILLTMPARTAATECSPSEETYAPYPSRRSLPRAAWRWPGLLRGLARRRLGAWETRALD